MSVWMLLAGNAGLLVVLFIAAWLTCVKMRDVTPVDSLWAFGMVAMALASWLRTGGDPARKALLLGICALWGLRLGGYLLWRWRTQGPDRRYKTMFAKVEEAKGWGFAKASLLMVFATQAPLLFVVCLPVQLGQLAAAPPVGTLGWIGAALGVIGIAFESIGDAQLVRFRRDPANEGQVMQGGLWRYTRHPNYFGDALTWWGLYLIAAETSSGLWALPGPIFLTYTLSRWSGMPTVEGRMKRKKPDYDDYIRRTSAFIPWPPKA